MSGRPSFSEFWARVLEGGVGGRALRGGVQVGERVYVDGGPTQVLLR